MGVGDSETVCWEVLILYALQFGLSHKNLVRLAYIFYKILDFNAYNIFWTYPSPLIFFERALDPFFLLCSQLPP